MKFLTSLLVLVALNVSLAVSATAKAKRNGQQRFQFDITWETKAPDGFSRPQILINGQSPGPLIHVMQGDSVEVSENDSLGPFYSQCSIAFRW